MSPDGGAIHLRLTIASGRVAASSVDSSRPRQPGRMFHDRSVTEVLGLLPTLFSLCGDAQLIAGLEAVEEATGVTIAAPQRDARTFLLAAETALEHGQRILRDWPALLDQAPDMAAAKALRAALADLRRLLHPARDWARPGGGVLAPDASLLAARLAQARRVVEDAILERSASGLLERLPDLSFDIAPLTADKAALAALLDADADGDFAARPAIDGQPRLTHPALRVGGPPLTIADLARGRLRELRACLDLAESMIPRLRPAPAADMPLRDGIGVGMVEAARGLLVHRIEIAGGLVRRWQILAPTEWNFHPCGVLAQALVGQAADAGLAWRARALAVLVDPCVELRLSIEG